MVDNFDKPYAYTVCSRQPIFSVEGSKVAVFSPQHAEDARTGVSRRGSTHDAFIPVHDGSCQTSAVAEDPHPDICLVDTGRGSKGLRAVNCGKKRSVLTLGVGSRAAGGGNRKRVRKTH